MNETHAFTVEAEAAGMRLDRFLSEQIPNVSRSRIQSEIERGNVRIGDREETRSRYALRLGDSVSILIPEEPTMPVAEEIPLAILYEDEVMIVVDKPAGMVVHPTTFEDRGSLVQALLALRPEIEGAVYDPESKISRLRPGIVHRLDKDTTGVIVVAKTRESMLHLSNSFKSRNTTKRYASLLFGWIPEERTVDAELYRKGGNEKNRMAASHKPGGGKPASTTFYPITRYAYDLAKKAVLNEGEPLTQPDPEGRQHFTYSEVGIATGRTHQIRVHGKFIGHPVLGDTLYGNTPSERLSHVLGIKRQMLHAKTLSIRHPLSEEVMTFASPLPEDMSRIISAPSEAK